MCKTVKMGVIGTGSFGNMHLIGIKETIGVEVAGVCDVNEDRAKEAAELYNVPYYTDYNKLLQDETIDAVSVVTPDYLHCEMVEAALKAGKHVLCEKPLALNLEDCKKMISAAKKYDKMFMVGQICRYTPAFVAAKEIVDRGEIGEIFFMESEYAHDYAYMKGNDNWRKRPDRHGLIGGGCHAVDLIRWFVGDPYEVFGYSNHFMLPEWPTADCTIGVMKFESGAIGKVFCSTGCKRDYTMRTVIYGTKGTIIVDNTSTHFTLYKAGEKDGDKIYGSDNHCVPVLVPTTVANHNISNEIADFVKLITTDKEVSINAVQGASTVSVCSAIVKSCETGLPEKVDYCFDI